MMEAFKACRNTDKKKEAADIAYIRNRLVPILPLWAHNTRCYSPFLLQVPTTNPVETWHSMLKCKGVTKDILQRFSLLGIVKHSLAIDKEYDLRAEEVEQKWKTRRHPLVTEFPELGRGPSLSSTAAPLRGDSTGKASVRRRGGPGTSGCCAGG
jgi:hypothetical protein